MILLPGHLVESYQEYCQRSNISDIARADYLKLVRFLLDFCEKYSVAGEDTERLRKFMNKLKEKRQDEDQRRRAYHAVSLYFRMLRESSGNLPLTLTTSPLISTVDSSETLQAPANVVRKSEYSEAGYQEKSSSPEWDEVLAQMAAEIKVRHYSRKTLKTYALWSRQFQRFLKNKPPQELTTEDVKEYLTYLAVKCRVAASTQNQAFNSLLFLFRHGLKRDFGILKDVPRAKKSLYVPVVLSRGEIDAILAHLYYPYNLVVNVLFGCGLRLFECLQLRVRDSILMRGF